MGEAPKTDRRGALKVIATTGGVVAAGALAMPAARFVAAPAAGAAGGGRWIKAIALEALKDGEPKRVALVADHKDAWTLEKQVELGAVWLLREGDAVKAWSVVCPHLGCAVDRSATGPGFYCPCHESSFDPAGGRLSGPSPRDMDALATRVDDGFVVVEFQRFRQGTPDKTPMG